MDLGCQAQNLLFGYVKQSTNKEYGIWMLSSSFLIPAVRNLSNIDQYFFFFSELPARAPSSLVSWCVDLTVCLGQGLRVFWEGLFPGVPDAFHFLWGSLFTG